MDRLAVLHLKDSLSAAEELDMMADLDCTAACWECVADDIRHYLYPLELGS